MAKYELNFLEDYGDDALLEEIRRVSKLVPGPFLTQREFSRFSGKVHHTTIRRRFGSWRAALDAAGEGNMYSGRHVSPKMKSQVARNLSDEQVLEEMRKVAKLLGKEFLSVGKFNKHSSIASERVIRNRFGSWELALKRAGLSSSPHAKRYTDQECFENLAKVWTLLSRRPSYGEMEKPPSTVSPAAYVIRWKTWRKALKAFVEWAAEEEKLPKLEMVNPEGVEEPKLKVRAKHRVDGPERRQVSPRLRFQVFKRDRFRCVAGGRSPANHPDVELHADHIVPVAKGGQTMIGNLQTLCTRCNLGKADS